MDDGPSHPAPPAAPAGGGGAAAAAVAAAVAACVGSLTTLKAFEQKLQISPELAKEVIRCVDAGHGEALAAAVSQLQAPGGGNGGGGGGGGNGVGGFGSEGEGGNIDGAGPVAYAPTGDTTDEGESESNYTDID